MNIETIKDILVARGYSERNATIVSKELSTVSDELTPLLRQWLDDENCKMDYSANGHSVKEFLDGGMKYPAAILTVDWIIKEPQVALKSITKGIR